MNIKYVSISETSQNGVIDFFKNNNCEINFDESFIFETNEFDEENQRMIEEKVWSYSVILNDKILLVASITTDIDNSLSESQVRDIIKKEVLENQTYYLLDYYVEYTIEKLSESIILNETNIEDELRKLNFENVEVIEGEKDRDCDNVFWNNVYLFSYKNKKYRLNVSGTAIADISYERWVDTFGYSISDWSLEEINGNE